MYMEKKKNEKQNWMDAANFQILVIQTEAILLHGRV